LCTYPQIAAGLTTIPTLRMKQASVEQKGPVPKSLWGYGERVPSIRSASTEFRD